MKQPSKETLIRELHGLISLQVTIAKSYHRDVMRYQKLHANGGAWAFDCYLRSCGQRRQAMEAARQVKHVLQGRPAWTERRQLPLAIAA